MSLFTLLKSCTYQATNPNSNTLSSSDPVNECNEENDCSDLSDELGCSYPNSTTPDDMAVGCYPTDFICNPHANTSQLHCIRKYKKCDGYMDCVSGIDEQLSLCGSQVGLVSSVVVLWGVLLSTLT